MVIPGLISGELQRSHTYIKILFHIILPFAYNSEDIFVLTHNMLLSMRKFHSKLNISKWSYTIDNDDKKNYQLQTKIEMLLTYSYL